MKKLTIIFILIFGLGGISYSQNNIKIKLFLDDSLVQSIDGRFKIKLKFKDKSDTLIIEAKDGEVKIPWLYQSLSYFELRYDNYFVLMTDYAAEIEGKNIFNELRNKWQVRIDNYKFAELTLKRFPKIRKNQYSIIFANTEDDIKSEGFGFFNGMNDK